jgi:hypothetical protein
MEEENLQPTVPDDANQPQEESAEEQRFAQIMHRVALGDTSVTSEVYLMQSFEDFAKKNR